MRNANIEELLKEAGQHDLGEGNRHRPSVRVAGTLGEPQADVTLDVAKPEVFGEAMDRVRATLKIAQESRGTFQTARQKTDPRG